jgi:hypothetical protein
MRRQTQNKWRITTSGIVKGCIGEPLLKRNLLNRNIIGVPDASSSYVFSYS